MQYGTLLPLWPAGNRLDNFIEATLAFLEARDRGFCQFEDCFNLGEISETKTSLCFCSKHYYERQGRRNLQVIRSAERGL